MSDLKSVGIKCEKLKMGFAGTVAINELLCLKNVGAQISLFFTS